jgi:hypothetical protein
MYQFSAMVTNDYTIEVSSNTYWSCKAEGNFKLSQYDGSGDTKINIEIPDDVMLAEGTVYFSYGDERCKYPKFEISLANLCYISSYPNYNICDDNGTKKKTVYFFYDEPLETFNLSVFCYDGWTVDTSDFNYVTSNNDVMIIASENDGELRIIPNHQCGGRNIIYVKLVKKKADS